MKLEYYRISEVSIQAEFFHQCRVANIPCYLGYKYEHSVFDAVIYDKPTREIYCLVEVKSYSKKDKEVYIGKQFAKYSRYGLPIFYIVRMEDIHPTINKIKELTSLKSF